MRQSACILAAVLTVVGVLSFADDAHAQDPGGTPSQPPSQPPSTQPLPAQPAPGQPAPGVAPAGQAPADGNVAPVRRPHDDDDDDEEDHIKHIALTLNPLGFAIGRYSIQADYVFAKHHAIVLNPYYNSTNIEINNVDVGTLSGFGAELGYRLYTGSKGSNGFFIGPSFLFGSWSASSKVLVPGQPSTDTDFTALGAALDLGGQAIIGPGVIVGGGFGLQYTKNSEDFNTNNFNIVSAAIAGGGVRPRFLLSVGFAF
jgi:hypothetical protein